MATRAHSVPRFFLAGFTAPESDRGPDPFVWLGLVSAGEVNAGRPRISRSFVVYTTAQGDSTTQASPSRLISRRSSRRPRPQYERSSRLSLWKVGLIQTRGVRQKHGAGFASRPKPRKTTRSPIRCTSARLIGTCSSSGSCLRFSTSRP
jgi:hypothetical protein